MNSTVWAAFIGVAGTVIIGVAGFGATMWNTRETLRAAQDSKLRDQRAEVYLDALAVLNHNQLKRDVKMRTGAFDQKHMKTAKAYIGAFDRPDPYRLEARLTAFASADVHLASQASYVADREAWAFFDSSQDTLNGPDSGAVLAQLGVLRAAADDADNRVVEVIRAELQRKGRELTDLDVFDLEKIRNKAENHNLTDSA
jgi:hypothetical protein